MDSGHRGGGAWQWVRLRKMRWIEGCWERKVCFLKAGQWPGYGTWNGLNRQQVIEGEVVAVIKVEPGVFESEKNDVCRAIW